VYLCLQAMCGITGAYAFSDSGRQALSRLQAATDAIVRRGPDSQGHFVYDCVGLGFRRLAILDLSADGNQPMTDEAGRYTIVFNGEIFNFRELRERLIKKGYRFHSQTDTEVILNLYISEGRSFIKKLNGFFGLAIYDKEENSLFIARDRYGVKPLHIYRDEDQLLFGSELKSLLALGVQRKLDYVALSQYLQLNYIPGPATIFKGIKKLLPGHYLFIQGNKVVRKRWYKIPYDPKKVAKNKLTYDEQQKKLVTLMDEAVERRLVADVPLGSFLSGGIDSSVITALAARHTPHLNTFSIGFRDEPFFDETKYANLVAKMHNTNHTVFSLSNDDLYEHLFQMLDYFDEPFADSSALAVHVLSQRTRQHVTVALSGDGADEIFGGYNKHLLWDILPKSRNSYFGNKIRQFQRFSRGMLSGPKDRYWDWASFASEKEATDLLSPTSRRRVDKKLATKRRKDILENIHADGDLNEVLLTDMQLVLPYDMLTKVDLMSMANSLEVRTPFLDYKVVDFAFSLPVSSKVDSNMKKRIVQDAFRPMLPPELYDRPKHGFEVPLLKWMRGELRPLIEQDLLADDFVAEQGIFDMTAVQKLKKQLFSSSPGDAHARIWALIVFQYWWKHYMAEPAKINSIE
jgi:asparagine synthase (glutamine-hydrolysing)